MIPLRPDELSESRRALLAMYLRVRRYAVPGWMIETATERRLAGDADGACAAARITVDIDYARVARACGQPTADLVADDVRHLAPDLLRWHLPRVLSPPGAVWNWMGVLRRYPAGGGASLMVDQAFKQPGRLKIWVRFGPDRGTWLYHLHRSAWDARHTDELRQRCGGADRIPFFHADGRPLDIDELPDGPGSDDPVAAVEWLTMLWDHGRTGEALRACGIALAPGEPDRWPARAHLAVERLAAEARHVLGPGERTVWVDGNDESEPFTDLELTLDGSGGLTARRRGRPAGEERILTLTEYRHPIDFDLLRFGYLRPDELHPAVARALFPAREAVGGGPPPPPRTAEGSPAERDRELMDRAYHGDTPGVLALLDAGFDPAARDDEGRTLLHHLIRLDHEVLLPRLVAAGLKVNAVDAEGHTPLHVAAESLSVRRRRDDLVDRLIDAGGTDLCRRRGVKHCTGSKVTRTPPPSEDEVWHLRPAPDAEQLNQLRAAVEPGRYRSLVRLARGLYRSGRGPREVLAGCYGVAFPDEFFALAERLPPVEDFDFHPWRLAVPPDRGGPVQPSDDDYKVRAVLDRDPDLVPLARLSDHHTEHGGLTVCYRLTELAAGRTEVFGLDTADPTEPVERCGPSLLAVLFDYHAAIVARLEALERDSRSHTEHRTARDRIEALLGTTPPPRAPEPVATLRGRASRGDYRSMGHLARALYASGLDRRAVLTECFGVVFPDEFFVMAGADPDDEEVPGSTTNLPWELAIPLDRGGPVVRPWPSMWRAERRVFGWDPDLVPLVALYDDSRVNHGGTPRYRRARHGDRLHCYRLSELAAGRSTVVGVPRRAAEDGGELSVHPSGPSLLTVLHEHASDRHELDTWEIGQPWNRGAGSLDDSDVEASREVVEQIEALQRRAATLMRDGGV